MNLWCPERGVARRPDARPSLCATHPIYGATVVRPAATFQLAATAGPAARRPSACARGSGRWPAWRRRSGALRGTRGPPRSGGARASAASASTSRRRIIGESAFARTSVQRSRISAKAASRVARFASSTLTYDEKSCIGTSSPSARSTARAASSGASRRARARAGSGACSPDRSPPSRARRRSSKRAASARRAAAMTTRSSRFGSTSRRSPAGGGGGASRPPRRRPGRARRRTSARSSTARRSRTSSSSFAAGFQPSFAARSPYSPRHQLAERGAVFVGQEAVLDQRQPADDLVEHDVVLLAAQAATRSRKRSIGAWSARTSAH